MEFLWIGEADNTESDGERKGGGKRSSGKSRPVEWRLVWGRKKKKEKELSKSAGVCQKRSNFTRKMQEEEFTKQTKQRKEQSKKIKIGKRFGKQRSHGEGKRRRMTQRKKEEGAP